MAKKIIFTGGGTVGHVTLNLLLIPQFIADGWEVHYIGDKRGVEKEQIDQSGLPVIFHAIATGKLRRYFSWQNVLDVFKVIWGILQSLVIMLKVRPQALFSKGGFVSVPPVIAGRLTGVPVFIHESDLSMGLANKIASKFATTVYTTFDETSGTSKLKHLGAVTKVGSQKPHLSAASQQELLAIQSAFDPNLKTLLFVGGSGGAKVFNDFVTDNKELMQDFNVINLTGDKALDGLSSHLYRTAYVTDLYQPLMDLADVVITRGGANTLFELLALKKLHLIVPLGREASRGDQLENAAYFEKQGYAKQLLEAKLNLADLKTAVAKLLENQDKYLSAMDRTTELKSPTAFYHLLLEDIYGKG